MELTFYLEVISLIEDAGGTETVVHVVKLVEYYVAFCPTIL